MRLNAVNIAIRNTTVECVITEAIKNITINSSDYLKQTSKEKITETKTVEDNCIVNNLYEIVHFVVSENREAYAGASTTLGHCNLSNSCLDVGRDYWGFE